jgi:hypothetical protein
MLRPANYTLYKNLLYERYTDFKYLTAYLKSVCYEPKHWINRWS